MPSETHRLLLTRRLIVEYPDGAVRTVTLTLDDPDGPPQPMLPAAMWRDGGERRAERIRREARDAALIAAIGKVRT